jgi:hypothetical protein
MIIKENTELGSKILIKDPTGAIVTKIKEFNTVTKEAILYGTVSYDKKRNKIAVLGDSIWDGKRKVVTFNCHLLGHKAFDKVTGEEIK